MALGVSLKPHQGRSWKRLRRIEIVARLEAAFISDQDIANHLGLTVAAIQAIKRSPEYLAKRITLSTGILSKYDQNILLTEDDKREEISNLAAISLQAVKTILLNPTHSDHARVALNLLDRDSSTAKISKMEHSMTTQMNIEAQNIRAQELLELIGGPVAELPGNEVKVEFVSSTPDPGEVEEVLEVETELEPKELIQ